MNPLLKKDAGAASTAVNNAAKGTPGSLSGPDPQLETMERTQHVGTDPHGHAQLGDVAVVVKFLQERGASLPQQIAKEFGWSQEQAYGVLRMLKDEGIVGIKQMRFFLKQASKFQFQSKILYRKSEPISVFQYENQEIKKGGPQGDDISRRSLGDYPKMRRTR